MSSLDGQAYPPLLQDGKERDHLIQTIKDWSIAKGLAVRPPPTVIPASVDPTGIAAINAPVTLFPSLFPRICFEQGKAAQKTYNELYARVSQDEAFLAQIVREVADGDDFIRNLWSTHVRVKQEGYVQDLSLGLFRSDYMVNQDATKSPRSLQVKQVEFNTIASSFGGLSSCTSALHKHLQLTEYLLLTSPILFDSLELPASHSVQGLAAGIRAAFEAYGAPSFDYPKCIVFLVQGDERNVFDQRHLEYQITDSSPGTSVLRLAFDDILRQTSIAQTAKRQLLYHMPHNPEKIFEVAVIYMRAGYGPGDYSDQRAWDARYHLERSAAIKCPTVLTQLAGTKKVQQVLATPRSQPTASRLGAFIEDKSPAATELRKTFTNIYPMDKSEQGLLARKQALDTQICRNFVLKPQREGGGNNIYREAIPGFLRSVPEEHWGSYILMEIITPPPMSNTILRNGRIEQGGVICELGIYGACLWNQSTGEVLYNEEAGYLLRTKGDKSEEGGVAAGFGCMDSCCLVDVHE